jgi:hypothetical protein
LLSVGSRDSVFRLPPRPFDFVTTVVTKFGFAATLVIRPHSVLV